MSSTDIYTYIEQNFNIKINDYQFKRDYIKNPLKKINKKLELPYKEDWYYLFITINLSYNELHELFKNISIRTLTRWSKYYQIKKDSSLYFQNICKQNIKKFGVKYPTQIKEIRQKGLETSLRKNGFKTFLCIDDGKKLMKQKIKEKYGVENVFQLNEIKEKSKQTCLKKYGVEYYSLTNDHKLKSKQTCLEKYGVENYNNRKQFKQTTLQKYGVENYNNRIKAKQTCLDKYGVENPSQYQEIQNKKYETMLKNETYGKSKPEDEIYKLLQEKFGDVKRQYKSDLYPFRCDFYIPSIDLYIEYQGMWTHGFEPYINSIEQQEIVKLWESKNSVYYNQSIHIWTVTDPLKRQIVKDNNLNWLEFFNMKQFMDWYNKKEE